MQKCAVRGSESECVKPVSFGWQDPGAISFPPPSTYSYNTSMPANSIFHDAVYPDLNGDGYPDLCKRLGKEVTSPQDYSYYIPYIKCWLSTATQLGGGYEIPTVIDNQDYPNPLYLNQNPKGSSIAFGDVDGDMSQELLIRPIDGVQGWRFDGTALVKIVGREGICKIGTQYCDNYDNYDNIQFPDVNGDGRVDICYRSDVGIDCYLTNDNGFALGEYIKTNICGNGSGCDGDDNKATIQYIDVNADGFTDIVYRGDNGVRAYYFNGSSFVLWSDTTICGNSSCNSDNVYTVRYPDINGDGLPDLCYRHDSGVICYKNTGSGWNTGAPINTGICYNLDPVCDNHDNRPTISYADFNNDGKQDLALRGDLGIRIYSSTGNGFELSYVSGICSNYPSHYTQCEPTKFETISYQDINADGKVDILYETSVGNGRILNTQVMPDLMTSIQDSYGSVVNINYKGLNDASVYTLNSSSGYPNSYARLPLQVVASTSSSDGVGGTRTLSYKYEDLRINLKGRGLLGFDLESTTDSKTGKTNITRYTLFDNRVRKVLSTTSSIAGKGTIGFTTNTWATRPSDKGRPYDYVQQSIEESYDIPTDGVSTHISTTETEIVALDSYGNVENLVVRVKDSNGTLQHTTQTTNVYLEDNPENWILGRLTSSSVTKTNHIDNLTATRSSSFSYQDDTGFMDFEAIEPGNALLGLETIHSYDPQYGNKTGIKKVDPSLIELDRDTSTQYIITGDDAGYFVDNVTNAKEHTEYHSYDPRYGQLTKLIGPNDLPTAWEYDPLGRKTLETRADGNTTAFSVRDCTAEDNCDGYVQTVTPSGAAESRVYFDRFARKIRSETDGFNSELYVKDFRYDDHGRLRGESNSYTKGYEGTQRYWTCYGFDVLDRIDTEWLPNANGCDNLGAVAKLREVVYNGLQTTITLHNDNGDQIKSEWVNLIGKRVRVDDDLTQLTYKYDPFGNLEEQTVIPFEYNGSGVRAPASNAPTVTTTMVYDLRGRKTSMSDEDKGDWSYTYNAFGELKTQTDANNQVTTMEYDQLGRLTDRVEVLIANPDPLLPNHLWQALNDNTTHWEYDNNLAGAKGIGKLDRVYNDTTGYSKTMSYDTLGRPQDVTTSILFTDYVTTTTYDGYGRVDTITYPTTPDLLGGTQRFAVKHNYDLNGYLMDVRNLADLNEIYWQAQWINARGQVTGFHLGDGSSTVKSYNYATGFLEGISTSGNLQALNYQYDRLGNVTERKDSRDLNQLMIEGFTYDGLNRLETATVTIGIAPADVKTYGYDALGNIKSKSDFANEYLYGQNGAGPHAVTKVNQNIGDTTPKATYSYDANGAMTSGDGREMRYKSFGKVYSIEKGGSYSTFGYNANRMRIVQTADDGMTVYLDPSKANGSKLFEKQIKGGVTTHVNYIFAAGGVIGEYRVKDDATSGSSLFSDETRYMHKDHLGSVDLITNADGSVLERMSFDPFGQRRITLDWSDPISPILELESNYGFTGHEHMDNLGIIHMNGRVYDPKLGRFLSADSHIQGATSSQAYNRYSYVLNNPLSATDPSGYFLKWLSEKIAKFMRSKHFSTVVMLATAYFTNGASLGWFDTAVIAFASTTIATGDIKSGLIAGISGGLSPGLGTVGAGLLGGAISTARGGKFIDGFLGAAFQRLTAGFLRNKGVYYTGDGLGFSEQVWNVMVAATAGGTGAAVGGGKFDNGAVSSVFSYLFYSGVNSKNGGGDEALSTDTLEVDTSSEGESNLLLASKGGKQNISVGEFNRNSNPADVKRAMENAKSAGNQSHYRKLKGLFKVIKRGGRGIGPVILLPPEVLEHIIMPSYQRPNFDLGTSEGWDACFSTKLCT